MLGWTHRLCGHPDSVLGCARPDSKQAEGLQCCGRAIFISLITSTTRIYTYALHTSLKCWQFWLTLLKVWVVIDYNLLNLLHAVGLCFGIYLVDKRFSIG